MTTQQFINKWFGRFVGARVLEEFRRDLLALRTDAITEKWKQDDARLRKAIATLE